MEKREENPLEPKWHKIRTSWLGFCPFLSTNCANKCLSLEPCPLLCSDDVRLFVIPVFEELPSSNVQGPSDLLCVEIYANLQAQVYGADIRDGGEPQTEVIREGLLSITQKSYMKLHPHDCEWDPWTETAPNRPNRALDGLRTLEPYGTKALRP